MTKNFNAALKNVARGYASTATRLAKGYSESARVRRTIKSNVEIKQGIFVIHVRAGDKRTAPDARAREYGSGIWARRGPKGKILIRPRKAKALVFPWDIATSPSSGKISPNLPRTKDGKVILKQVEHPGIDADNDGQGYLAPAIRETNKLIRARMGKDLGNAIRADIRAGFSVRR